MPLVARLPRSVRNRKSRIVAIIILVMITLRLSLSFSDSDDRTWPRTFGVVARIDQQLCLEIYATRRTARNTRNELFSLLSPYFLLLFPLSLSLTFCFSPRQICIFAHSSSGTLRPYTRAFKKLITPFATSIRSVYRVSAPTV